MTRRRRVLSLVLGVCLAMPVAGNVRAGDAFTLVLLPDTQHYSDSAANIVHFDAQTSWIVARRETLGIVFVTHVGDIVDNGATILVEWDRADAAMDTLDGDLVARPDGILPYSAVAGNHDFDVVGNKAAALEFRARFGPSRYTGRTWFYGASPSEVNMAQTFEAGGRTWLHLGLEWRPSDDALSWAQSVLTENPDLPAIVSTHQHLGVGIPATRSTGGDTPDSGGDNSGRSVYGKLVEPYPQVAFVLSGHFSGNGRLHSTPALGHDVLELVADYQGDPAGGNGWLLCLEVRPATSEIAISTVSPTYVAGRTPGPDRSVDPESNVTVAFDVERLYAELFERRTLHFRDGQDAGFGTYTGTRDTHVGDGTGGVTLPDVAHGDVPDVIIDGNGDEEQGLVRFEGIVGAGPGQIPAAATVIAAVLTVTTEGPNAGSADGARLHRMIAAWDEASTWDSLGAGVQIGTEARATFDLDTAALVQAKTTRSFDVTSSVQAWVDGETNQGWVFLANGDDQWSFRSSEWGTVVERPMLTVSLADPCPAPRNYCGARPNSTGQSARIRLTGSTSLGVNAMRLEATGLPTSTIGLFFRATDRVQRGVPFGNGLLCAGGTFQRLGAVTVVGGLASQLQDLAGGNYADVQPGDTRYAQFWYRNPAGGGLGFNLSDALEIRFCP